MEVGGGARSVWSCHPDEERLGGGGVRPHVSRCGETTCCAFVRDTITQQDHGGGEGGELADTSAAVGFKRVPFSTCVSVSV